MSRTRSHYSSGQLSFWKSMGGVGPGFFSSFLSAANEIHGIFGLNGPCRFSEHDPAGRFIPAELILVLRMADWYLHKCFQVEISWKFRFVIRVLGFPDRLDNLILHETAPIIWH